MNYNLSEIASIVCGRLVGQDLQVTAVATDSRSHCPDDALFVAIKGYNHDAHNFIADLLTRGVKAFMVDKFDGTVPQGVGMVVVDNSLAALQKLAAHHREMYKGTVVAITGSNGKTIVKEWIANLWMPQNGKLTRSPRSYNSQLGVALSLLMIEGDEKMVVIEAGISKPGEMVKLWEMIHPDVVLFTNLGPAHSENFISPEHKLTEKEILFRGARKVIRATQQGNIDQRNLSCVLGLYDYLGFSHRDISCLEPIAMRLEVQEGILGSVIVNDSYNSDLASLTIALDFAAHQSGSRRILILSDILQSGDDFHRIYSEVARLISARSLDMFIGVGEQLCRFRGLFEDICETRFYSGTRECLEAMQKHWFSGSVVLIKGARVFGFERISAALESRTHTTVLEVNLTAMAANLNRHRTMLKPGIRTMAMVKASGYGSGTGEVALMLQHQRVDYLAVAFADEGIELRRWGIHLPIVVLNADNGSFAAMIENCLEPEIYSIDSLQQYIAQVRRCSEQNLPIHIKLDTGMHRLGFTEGDIDDLLESLSGQNSVYVGSIFSHLAASEDSAEDDFTRSQISLFDKLSRRIIENQQPRQTTRILRHICNSAAITRFAEAHFDMVRLGIGLYSDSTTDNRTVCRLFTRIVQIKTLQVGETVGYNRRGVIKSPSKIAILPIGYADGLSRAFGRGAASFNVAGVMCPTIGNICMDTTIIDVTGAPLAHEGDRVEIFGLAPTIAQLATVRGTIDYEILTSVASRIKRVYITE